ncbi:hypothetical protein ASC80_12010 [Afipia sp. Root123D2]|nr:hypothetical protein ASC80_12010 [Afipia sp. Root123D2]
MLCFRWEIAAIARPQVELRIIDRHVRATLQQIADLLKIRMSVRERSWTTLHDTQHHLQVLSAHVFTTNQSGIHRVPMICRRIAGHRSSLDQVFFNAHFISVPRGRAELAR